MSYLLNNQQKLNEIIFANRNKSYGAYVIRSSYGNTVLRSLSFMSLGIGSVMLVAFYLNRVDVLAPDLISGQIMDSDSIHVTPFDTKPDEKKAEPKKADPLPAEQPAKKPSIESSNVVVSDTVSNSEKTLSASATVNTKSTVTTSTETGTTASHPDDVGSIIGTVSGPKKDFEVDSVPEFEGGLAALKRFVASNLRYPHIASEEGKGGTVHVQFVVDEFGRVGSLDLQNQIGYGMDEEALRVVGLIPKFKKPAKAKGKAVKMYFHLPIKFVAR